MQTEHVRLTPWYSKWHQLFVLGGRWAAEEDGDITRIGSNSGEPPSGGVYGDVFYLVSALGSQALSSQEIVTR